MKRLPSILGALVVTASLAACAESPTQVEAVNTPEFAVIGTCPSGYSLVPRGKAKQPRLDANGNGWVCVGNVTGNNGRIRTDFVDDTI